MVNKIVKRLDDKIREVSKDFYHSRDLAKYSANGNEVSLDLRDIMLASAITSNNVLLSGSTGAGKTHFSKMVMAALYGSNATIIQMDDGFSFEKLRDIDFKAIEKGRKLSDAIDPNRIVYSPGVIIDEYNRANDSVRNSIQGWLQNGEIVFESGLSINPGVKYAPDETYQWKIATVNEGKNNSGAKRLDKAARDRFSLEINMDIFPTTEEDKQKLNHKKNTNVFAHDGKGLTEEVLAVRKKIDELEIDNSLQYFLTYLQRMDQCKKSPTKTKLEIENFSPEYCNGCHLAANNGNICGNVYAPSSRSIIALQNLAKGFAVIRSAKTNQDEIKVESEDITAAAPFVLYGKLAINPGWVEKESQSSKWFATKKVLKIADEKFGAFLKENFHKISSVREDETNLKPYFEELQTYAENNDAWAWELDR